MYNMEIKVLGFKARVEVIVISVVIGMLLCSHLICGCATQEGMDVAGAAIGYKMNDGVHNDKYDAKVDMDEVAGGEKLAPAPFPSMIVIWWGTEKITDEDFLSDEKNYNTMISVSNNF